MNQLERILAITDPLHYNREEFLSITTIRELENFESRHLFFTPGFYRLNGYSLIIDAIEAGNSDLVKLIAERTRLTRDELRQYNNELLQIAVQNSQTDIAQFFIEEYDLNRNDATSEIRQIARRNGGDIADLIDDLSEFEPPQSDEDIETPVAQPPSPVLAEIPVLPEEQLPTLIQQMNINFSFNIDPPLRISTSAQPVANQPCFNLEFEPTEIRRYLDRNVENIAIVNIAEGTAACFTREQLQYFMRDSTYIFYECGGRMIGNDRAIQNIATHNPFIKIPVNENGSNVFIHLNNLQDALDSRERIYYLIPQTAVGETTQLMVTHTISRDSFFNNDFVSGNHCQYGSNVLLSRLVKGRFSIRAPSWTLRH